MGTYSAWKVLLRCRLLGGAKRFGAYGGGKGRGHTVGAIRLQLVLLQGFCTQESANTAIVPLTFGSYSRLAAALVAAHIKGVAFV